jgi:hypothetical protein
MMTEELSTIHIGMIAAAESFGFDFDEEGEDTGVGKGASRSIFDSGELCISYPFSSLELRAEDMVVIMGALDERERVGRRADKDCGEGIFFVQR